MSRALEVWAVVVGGGAGERLGGDRPKAFARFAGRTLVARSLVALDDHPGIDGIVLVVPPGWEDRATIMAEDLATTKVAAAVAGGRTRAASVRAGLAEVPDRADVVLVHDAARPLLREPLIDRVLAGVATGADGVVPALPVVDTVKRVAADGRVVETVDRRDLVAVQTPQGFPAAVLRRVMATVDPGDPTLTDCASAVERDGGRVITVPGDEINLKVTSSEDLARAEDLALRPEGA